MADSWPVGDPMETGSGGLWGALTGIAGAVGKGAGAGFGLGEAGGAVHVPMLDKLGQGVTDMTLSQYPGYGDLWTYDARDGVEVTAAGAVALGVAAVALWFVLFSGGR